LTRSVEYLDLQRIELRYEDFFGNRVNPNVRNTRKGVPSIRGPDPQILLQRPPLGWALSQQRRC
jgi:hypothetical protein